MRHGRICRVLVDEGTAQGQMPFWDATLERWVPTETSELFWDDTAKILKPVALTVAGCTVLGLDSAVFQPTTDSTTFFQVLDANGGTPIFNVDSANERIGIGNNAPRARLEITDNVEWKAFIISGEGKATGAGQQLGFLLENTKASSTDNIANLTFAVKSDDEVARTCFEFYASFSDIVKAQRTSLVQMNGIENGSFDTVMAFAGLDVGIGELAPETKIEMTASAPYLTLHNSTHEDTDGGRESRLNFKGEQSGGEETTLARIEISHDGAADDQKGKIVISTNDGSDADTPTEALTIDSARNIKASGNTISDSSGNLTSANGANFGPAGVTSITVLNGIVTAIS